MLISEGIAKYDGWNQGMSMAGLPQGKRPREKRFNKDAASLSDSRAVGRNAANRCRGVGLRWISLETCSAAMGLGRFLGGRSREPH